MTEVVRIKTEHVAPLRSLIELLKDLIDEVNIECVRDDEMNKKIDNETSNIIENNKEINNQEINNQMQKKKKKNKLNNTETETENENKKDNKDNKDNKDDDKEKKVGGIKIVAMDKTQTLLVNVKLFANKFDEFKVKRKVHDIGINLNQLYKSLKSLQKDDSLTLSINEDDKDWLLLKIKNDKKRYVTLDKIKLMDINKSKYDIPPTEFDVVITLDTEEFHTICKEMNQVQDVVDIHCTKNVLTFTSTGDSTEKIKSYYPNDNGISINFSKDSKSEVIQGIFELKYLVMFTNKSQHLCPKIQLFMKNDYPLFVRFTVATLGKLLFCISPYDEGNIEKEFNEDESYYNQKEINYNN
jgi:proliferating cell nuclear antigen